MDRFSTRINFFKLFLVFSLLISRYGFGQETVRVAPKEIDDVLNNPGKGFMTFQRFNGDTLNYGQDWTEGLPIEYQDFNGTLENKDHPDTRIAYYRIYWRYIEPEQNEFRWDIIDRAIDSARSRNQTLLLRIAPYGMRGNYDDVPDWYRKMVGDKEEWLPDGAKGWRVDANDPRYALYYGHFIKKLGERYDGNPYFEAIDLSIVGFWGEGRGTDLLDTEVREALINAYTDNFKQTPIIMLLTDPKTSAYALSQSNVGWRIDCLGDLGERGFDSRWSHMMDYYPQHIINDGMEDAWKKGPVSLEVCWVIKTWLEKGWDIDYIIEQSLKWHVSSINGKSSSIPEVWKTKVDEWVKRMGYRFALRKFTYPEYVEDNRVLSFTSWWENKGVAPIYKENFRFAIRVTDGENSVIRTTDADIRDWMPGDNLYNSSIYLTNDLPKGNYSVEVALVDKDTQLPGVDLAIEGRTEDGWYRLGDIELK